MCIYQASLVAHLVKNPPVMQKTLVQFLGWEVPLENERVPTPVFLDFPSDSVVKKVPAMQETWVQDLGWENSLEEGLETDSSILAWRILMDREPGELESVGFQRVGHDWVTKMLSHVWLFETPCTAAHQASLSCSNSTNVELMPSSHVILCHPLLPLP